MMNRLIIDEDGTKRWINEKGLLHREDGPALEYSFGSNYWYFNGEYHREDGPAIEYNDGGKSYWYHGQYIKCDNDEEFKKLIALKAFW